VILEMNLEFLENNICEETISLSTVLNLDSNVDFTTEIRLHALFHHFNKG
jgi:hypothetical protein